MEKIKFKDGTTLDITQATTSEVTVSTTLADFETVVGKFTKDNLESFSILDADDNVLSTMAYYKPTGYVTIAVQESGILATVGIAKIDETELRTQALEDAINFLIVQ